MKTKTPIRFKKCNNCTHQREKEIFSLDNVFCSYWVETV